MFGDPRMNGWAVIAASASQVHIDDVSEKTCRWAEKTYTKMMFDDSPGFNTMLDEAIAKLKANNLWEPRSEIQTLDVLKEQVFGPKED